MDPSACRIIDANFNRAREALRVMEEFARFVLDDGPGTDQAKRLRHELAAVAAALPAGALLAARDAAGDVGAAISTPSEARRGSTREVATAAAKRCAEALRCLEEYGKLIDASLASRIERLRYDAYGLEQRLLLDGPRRARLAAARLHVIVTASHCRGGDWLAVAAAALEGGADVLQLREKSLPDVELLARARRIVALARQRGALAIINDRPDIARLADADGVHLGQDDLAASEARAILGPHRLVGRSSHRREQARAAAAERPDYLAIGPVFQTAIKPQSAPIGTALAGEVARTSACPVVAIGGIVPQNIGALAAEGVRCVAVCRAVIGADDPAAVCRALRRALDAAG